MHIDHLRRKPKVGNSEQPSACAPPKSKRVKRTSVRLVPTIVPRALPIHPDPPREDGEPSSVRRREDRRLDSRLHEPRRSRRDAEDPSVERDGSLCARNSGGVEGGENIARLGDLDQRRRRGDDEGPYGVESPQSLGDGRGEGILHHPGVLVLDRDGLDVLCVRSVVEHELVRGDERLGRERLGDLNESCEALYSTPILTMQRGNAPPPWRITFTSGVVPASETGVSFAVVVRRLLISRGVRFSDARAAMRTAADPAVNIEDQLKLGGRIGSGRTDEGARHAGSADDRHSSGRKREGRKDVATRSREGWLAVEVVRRAKSRVSPAKGPQLTRPARETEELTR